MAVCRERIGVGNDAVGRIAGDTREVTLAKLVKFESSPVPEVSPWAACLA